MLELGEESASEHYNLIETAKIKGIKAIYIGSEFDKVSDQEDSLIFENVEAAKAHLASMDLNDTLVLVKGSRGIKLEQVLELF